MSFKYAIIVAALCFSLPAFAEPLSPDSIVALSSMGLGDEAIIAKIKSSESKFDLTTDQMIYLKKKGVTGPVIAAMLNGGGMSTQSTMSVDSPDPMVPHPSGVYLLDYSGQEQKMIKIDATVTNQAKTGGIFGYALTGGLASMSVKAAIQNETARVRAKGQPFFYFFFDESNATNGQSNGAWLAGTAATVSSPGEFTLIKLNKKDGRREARVGSVNIAGAKTGVMDKDRIQFDYKMVRPGVYKAKMTTPLESGEYGFIYAIAGSGSGGALTARIFDFSVE
ncbi:hypothetical protein [Aquisediminimonas sediminicola]|uniref:hypothetical protein n=1 Tax=Alteraquisediminimonas sediminicola TaxID=2676787 RepID=UPI001C8DBCEE|nr:hypothetical protein [Aquisediminimonas sediminicola]